MKKFVFIIIILLLFPLFVFPDDDSEPAVLVRGPIFHNGIEYLGVNAIPSEYGEYVYQNELVTVYYTTDDIFLSEDWTAADCGLQRLYVLDAADGRRVAAYTDKKAWTAFLSFEPESDYFCDFIEIYTARQNYFLNIARDDTGFSFPAILEID